MTVLEGESMVNDELFFCDGRHGRILARLLSGRMEELLFFTD
jgi:hypothetical protein